MALLLILFTIVLLFTVLLFTVKSRINLVLDSTSSDMHLTLFWLYPFLKVIIKKADSSLVMNVFLLNKRILTRDINRMQNGYGNKSDIRSFNPTNIRVDTRYGFRDPFATGLACSAITLLSEFFNVESLQQKPDFLAVSDYINLDATARLNLGHSLVKLI